MFCKAKATHKMLSYSGYIHTLSLWYILLQSAGNTPKVVARLTSNLMMNGLGRSMLLRVLLCIPYPPNNVRMAGEWSGDVLGMSHRCPKRVLNSLTHIRVNLTSSKAGMFPTLPALDFIRMVLHNSISRTPLSDPRSLLVCAISPRPEKCSPAVLSRMITVMQVADEKPTLEPYPGISRLNKLPI